MTVYPVPKVYIKAAPSRIDVSNYLKDRLDIWVRTLGGIGNFQAFLNNDNGQHNGTFAGQDEVLINFVMSPSLTVTMFQGYLDKAEPNSDATAFSKYHQTTRLSGRDWGQDLMNKMCAAQYPGAPADTLKAIIQTLFTATSCEIALSALCPEGPVTQYVQPTDYLLNHLTNLFSKNNYDAFVDEYKELLFFAIGSESSGITLKSIAGDITNNIIGPIEIIDFDVNQVFNYILAEGDKLTDGWTEGTASKFGVGAGMSAATNEYSTVSVGVASIKFYRITAGTISFYLDFPVFDYNNIDLSNISVTELAFLLRLNTSSGAHQVEVRLTDTSSNVIGFKFHDPFNPSEYFADAVWQKFAAAIGKGAYISPITSAYNQWRYVTGTSFTWIIDKIEWLITDVGSTGTTNEALLDGLSIPIVTLRAIKEDPISQGKYRVRQKKLPCGGIQSYNDLAEIAQDFLDKHNEKFQSLKITAKGTAGIISNDNKWRPGYSVDVNAPLDGINGTYRMVSPIHHTILENPGPDGEKWLVEVMLVPYLQKTDISWVESITDPVLSLYFAQKRELERIKMKEEFEKDWWAPLPKPIGFEQVDSRFPMQSYFGVKKNIFSGEAAFGYSSWNYSVTGTSIDIYKDWLRMYGPNPGASTNGAIWGEPLIKFAKNPWVKVIMYDLYKLTTFKFLAGVGDIRDADSHYYLCIGFKDQKIVVGYRNGPGDSEHWNEIASSYNANQTYVLEVRFDTDANKIYYRIDNGTWGAISWTPTKTVALEDSAVFYKNDTPGEEGQCEIYYMTLIGIW